MRWRTRTRRRPTGLPYAGEHPGSAYRDAERAAVDVFVLPDFLTDLECLGLRTEMDMARQVTGAVRTPDEPEADSIDPSGRSARDCDVSDETVRAIGRRIAHLAPRLAAHFGQDLAEFETPHFVVYGPGDFYRSHRDLYRDVVVPDPIARRRVSVVIFLNDTLDFQRAAALPAAEPAPRYGGGILRLASHDASELAAERAWPVPARQGLLVAFLADTWHEVTPITDGRRYTIVTLLLAPRPERPQTTP
ncbi:MAG TPA: 2OG-Fe(II) oxygenase [Acidimicrobiia bacterium]|nr:2OG-Fe(II) oxygenase [Acidimicrobiia bacterium]